MVTVGETGAAGAGAGGDAGVVAGGAATGVGATADDGGAPDVEGLEPHAATRQTPISHGIGNRVSLVVTGRA